MLRRLELLGFKSFADKTLFEFGAGITAIVGPNGSGKSNVVDSIKWVLGEQSAKSLRGKEMADVIFNGSGTRRSQGFAEASLTFDNRNRHLAFDADDVTITRRVYRPGESEYLINKTPARLRDFRDLFLGTGAGTEAYSVIEQGKVDVLLQASARDRRALFEEAAGISRFKARKLESLRKLEHVEQNLLRLGDIAEEVEKQLRSVKLQAGKARRYQEHADRLRELRVSTGLAELGALSDQLEAAERRAEALAQNAAIEAARSDSIAARLIQVESLIEELDQQIRALEGRLTDVRQEIGRLESEIAYERAHARDVAAQIERLRGQWSEFSSRVRELERHIAAIAAETAAAEQQYESSRAALEAEAQQVERLRTALEADRQRVAGAQARFLEALDRAGRVRNELAALESQEQALGAGRQRLTARRTALERSRAALAAEAGGLAGEETTLEQQRAATRAEAEGLEREVERMRTTHRATEARLAAERSERGALAARIEILEDLERRREGLARGVQDALVHPALAASVVGLVADLVQVGLEHAAAIERALGERAQHVVLRDHAALLELLRSHGPAWQGPVAFIALDRVIAEQAAEPTATAGGESLLSSAGFVAQADACVRTPPGLEPLAAHVLGRTVLVRDLDAAFAMAHAARQPVRFVTLHGELLEPDGTLTAGAPGAAAGLVSRKSQLRALGEESQARDASLGALEGAAERVRRELEDTEAAAALVRQRLAGMTDQGGRMRSRLEQCRLQMASLDDELRAQAAEITEADAELGRVVQRSRALHSDLERADAEVAALRRFIDEHEADIAARQSRAEERQKELQAGQVDLAKSEGRLIGLRQRLAAVEADLEDRRRAHRETHDAIAALVESKRGCERKMLAATGRVAALYLDKERLAREVVQRMEARETLREQRQELHRETQSARASLQAIQADLHRAELEASALRHQRGTLVERIREDYGIDLESLVAGEPAGVPPDRDAVQQEIQELRRKIAALGNVNLEAIQELAELETRAATLHAQLEDLNQSKGTLSEIIRKINQDSARLFLETLEAVRGHFGELFRKLFGGGRADIVLENESDVLETGIDIVARPPGKELRSLSLLSGGEKTLTAVALLLAVFRSKPSPFCILDEVDAALDEANIDRFSGVLREFSTQSQFILITHSKKTMLCADVLYGITMQESGVSKRVSVRFEDVNDRGEISAAALERSGETAAGKAEEPAGDQAAA